MSALALHLLKCGARVTGSDREENSRIVKLRKLGAQICVPHNARFVEYVCPNLVIRTSAVSLQNEEIIAAQKAGIPVLLREELLGQIFDGFETRIAVCGTHGKTTVTAMIHHMLECCGIDHAAFIGGDYLGDNYFFGKNCVVAEACEYNHAFLHLHPTICVCLNAEFDHPDCYIDQADVESAFRAFFAQSQSVVLPASQCELWQSAIFFGSDAENTYENGFHIPQNKRSAANMHDSSGSTTCFCADALAKSETTWLCARNVSVDSNGRPCFEIFDRAKPVASCKLHVCGRHNVQNALAALSAAKPLGLSLQTAAHALQSFEGVDRRWTEQRRHGLRIVCDYAHHPTEIAAAIAAAKDIVRDGGKIFAVFQPHTYSRTKAFLQRFATCFDGADMLILLPVFAARERPSQGATSLDLFRLAKALGKNVRYFATFESAAAFVKKNAAENDLALLIGAGDVYKLFD